MTQLGHHFGEGSSGDPDTEPNSAGRVIEAVARADLRRARQAALGAQVHPEVALFATRLARAVEDGPTLRDPDPDPEGPRGVSAVRQVVFGGGAARTTGGAPGDVALPSAPALVCDRSGRIVRVNDALLRLAGRTPDASSASHGGLFGTRLAQLVVGPDVDARLLRPDGSLVRVRVVRWDLPGSDLSAAVLVELDGIEAPDRTAERRWTAEVERMAGVGRWSFELATATLRRTEALDELYRSVGVDPDGIDATPLEGEQVALLCQRLRAGAHHGGHEVELELPGDRVLSCRAEVECAEDGTPVRLIGVVRDLSIHRAPAAVRRRVEHTAARFADLMALVPGGVALLDSTGHVLDANAGMCALLDVTPQRLIGTAAADLSADPFLHPARPPWDEPAPEPDPVGDAALPGWLRPVAPGPEHLYRLDAVPLLRGDGTTVWCQLAVSATTADDGSRLWLVVGNDVSEQRRASELLRSAGVVDELTRLPNRAATLALVDRLLGGPARDRVAVVCGDLDDFSRVNSSLGHEAGDDLLVRLAARLQRELPVGCTAARLSGDEFVVVCDDHVDVGGPEVLARTVADLLRTTVTVFGRPVQMTASVGVATPARAVEVSAADLLRFAEAAMQDAKRRQCRGGIALATDGVVSSATRALELEAELQAAIAGNALMLDYQPVVGPDGTIVSAEALVRWQHAERGLIAPAEFLPVAQRSGLLRELDLWVLRTAAREAATWPEHRGSSPAVAVNLAGLLPGDPDFLPAVREIVAETGLPWDRLVLELVETSLVALPPQALAAMDELAWRGVRFAVDDFGTGYSSLARLKELPAQIVKIDRSFVTGIGTDPADFAVARAVVDMARAMGRTTVAEGVETAEQFHVLRGIGVDAYQGWLFSRPLATPELRDVLAGGRLPTPAAAGLLP